MRNNVRWALLAAGCACGLALLPSTRAEAQQIVDPDFKVVVERPAYTKKGPVVAIDEAHQNFHTMGGQYKPYADLLRADGYTVKASQLKFAKGAFDGVDVLVVANALSKNAAQANPGAAAFTDDECDALRDWVRGGGKLLLIADHAPFGSAAENLASRFGVAMGKGWAFDQASAGGITTQLTFSRENGLLGAHPILLGRNTSEEVKNVRSFTGQSLSVPQGATVLLKLSASTREAPSTNDLDAEDDAIRASGKPPEGTKSSLTTGRAQGIAMTFGKGRIVVLGEAGMFSAQIATLPDPPRQIKFGMNVPGNDDRQFALNVAHWLSGLLK